MTDRRKEEIFRYRTEQAAQALDHTRTLLAIDGFGAAVNRSYYAMFYAVLALLATRDLGTSKHAGAIALFDREFVKAGVLSKDLSKHIHQAFDLRQDSDYRELVVVSRSSAEETLSNSDESVARIKQHLLNSGFLVE